jgi:hypothetical protein
MYLWMMMGVLILCGKENTFCDGEQEEKGRPYFLHSSVSAGYRASPNATAASFCFS